MAQWCKISRGNKVAMQSDLKGKNRVGIAVVIQVKIKVKIKVKIDPQITLKIRLNYLLKIESKMDLKTEPKIRKILVLRTWPLSA